MEAVSKTGNMEDAEYIIPRQLPRLEKEMEAVSTEHGEIKEAEETALWLCSAIVRLSPELVQTGLPKE
ncbi:hypothetical protein WA026_005597 [Henosepilachna vigintioctopunctata]|uniref:Uncharacterized protein n=1 Tax=Henosepilachna vigintioctopunctata TaxID=420089 RepID=A0AAW1U2M0_9CUCU